MILWTILKNKYFLIFICILFFIFCVFVWVQLILWELSLHEVTITIKCPDGTTEIYNESEYENALFICDRVKPLPSPSVDTFINNNLHKIINGFERDG